MDGDRILESNRFVIFLHILRSSLFVRLFITAGWLTTVYGHIVLPENLLAIICVGLGIGGRWAHPSYWPPQFGSIEEAYTLRRYWGKTHLIMSPLYLLKHCGSYRKFWLTALRRVGQFLSLSTKVRLIYWPLEYEHPWQLHRL